MRTIISLLFFVIPLSSFASIIGISTHPFESNENLFNAEFNSRFSRGSANGLQLRYLRSFNSKFNADAGFRVFKNERSTLFASATYEIFPDYMEQPQVSIKGFVERTRVRGTNINTFGAAPIISKGYSFWDYPAYPYLSIPMNLSLIEDTDKYEFVTSLTMGVTGEVPIDGFRNVLANLEANLNLRNSASYLALGLSMKFQ